MWICPNCDTKHDDDSAREECWESMGEDGTCGKELCEKCCHWVDMEVFCDLHATDTDPVEP